MKTYAILALGASVLTLAAAAPASAQSVPAPEDEQAGDITTGAGAEQAGEAKSGATQIFLSRAREGRGPPAQRVGGEGLAESGVQTLTLPLCGPLPLP